MNVNEQNVNEWLIVNDRIWTNVNDPISECIWVN